MSRIKQETLSGAKWAIIQKCTLQPLMFIYGMVLAHLISAEEMGILALTGIFFALANSLKEAGMGRAIIRKQNRTDTDLCTVFWFNIVTNIILCVAFWVAAPFIAAYFNQPPLTLLTRISAIMMLLNATTSVHSALFSAERNFKTPAIISLVSTLPTIPIALTLAYYGWSYWSVVYAGVVSGLLTLVLIWCYSPWKPKFKFSWVSFHEFFSFGFKLSLSGFVYSLYQESRKLVIGKFYTPAQLAFYSRGNQLCSMPISLLQAPLDNIIYPILSTIQDDNARLDKVYRQYMRLCVCPIMWIMLTLSFNAESIVHLLYGTNWLQCVPYAQMLCIGYSFGTVIRVNHNYLMVKGRSDLLLRREIILRIFGLTAMGIGAYFSVMGICVAYVLESILNVYLTGTYTLRISSMTIKEQASDFFPYLFIVVMVNIPSLIMVWLQIPFYISAFVGPGTALLLYVYVLHYKKDEAYTMILGCITASNAWQRIRQRFCRG